MSGIEVCPTPNAYIEALRAMTLRYERVVQALSILREMDEIDHPAHGIEEIARRILEAITLGLAAENCSLMLLDNEGQSLELRAAYSPVQDRCETFEPGAWSGCKFRIGQGIVGKVAETGRAARIADVTKDSDFLPLPHSPVEVRSLLCFPLRVSGRTTGVLNFSHSGPDFFSVENERLLELVAERAARIFTTFLLRERVRETEAHYRLVAENAGDAILVFDIHGRVVSANPAVERITGIPAERYVCGAVDWEAGIHPEDLERFLAHRTRLLDRQVADTLEYRHNDARGKMHSLEQSSSPLFDASGQVAGIVSVARDVTERRQAEEELGRYRNHLEALVEERTAELKELNEDLKHEIAERQEAEDERRKLEAQVRQAQKLESLGVLAGGIAHDFNNLLVSILGNASMALMDLAVHSPARDSIQQIENAAERAADLAKQMLAYSGRGKFEVQEVGLSELVEDMAHLLKVSTSKKAFLKLELDPNLPSIQGDAAQIRQVVMNLIINASEALGNETGVVTVITGAAECDRACLQSSYLDEDLPEGAYVYVQVSDTGCGMDPETCSKLFDPFFTTKFTGRGLGLAAVLGIVRGHRGALKIDSAPGEGSTFRILFPACTGHAPRKASRPKGKAEPWRGNGTVLVVDDEDVVRAVAQKALERVGFSVLLAGDGCEAVRMFRQHAENISAVLLDLTMPEMNGEEAYREMRRIKPDARVILSSGYSEQEAASHFAGQGLAGFIHKPYRATELSARLREVLNA